MYTDFSNLNLEEWYIRRNWREVRNMCSYSQVIEDRCVERGIEKGILIYRTLLETKSIQQTAVKTKEPVNKVKKIAEQYQVEVLE